MRLAGFERAIRCLEGAAQLAEVVSHLCGQRGRDRLASGQYQRPGRFRRYGTQCQRGPCGGMGEGGRTG